MNPIHSGPGSPAARSALRIHAQLAHKPWCQELHAPLAAVIRQSAPTYVQARPRIQRLPAVALGVLALVGLGAGCHTSGASNDTSAGGTSSRTNPAGEAGTSPTSEVVVDPWEPPTPTQGECSFAPESADPATTPNYLNELGCRSDFDTLALEPLNSSIPGASAVKVVLDRANERLYFQNGKKYAVHFEFATANLSVANGFADVGAASSFNATQYSAPDRRFLLGAVTYYSGPNYWTLEMAPYDTASADSVEKLFRTVQANSFFGPSLVFHPTSDNVARNTRGLAANIHVKTTEQIEAAIDYQPLRSGEAYGKLRFIGNEELAAGRYGFREIVVLETLPNDLAATAGIITQRFQTPLSHVNVRAMNRGTPNLGLRDALTYPKLVALAEKWVKLSVDSTHWDIVETTQTEADAWWQANRPAPSSLAPANTDAKDLVEVEQVTERVGATSMLAALEASTSAFGAEAANYSILAQVEGFPVRKALAIPLFYYVQFMQENGFFEKLQALTQLDEWSDLSTRFQRLEEFRAAIRAAPVNPGFQELLRVELEERFSQLSVRFLASTNAEGLAGSPCAGCYDSHHADPADWTSVLDAVRANWASVWSYRAFQEREYAGIDHTRVAMGLLVQSDVPGALANGVAVTQNIYVPSGMDPAYYVNLQPGEVEVAAPDPGVQCDAFLYYYAHQNQPMTWLARSSIARPSAEPVLTTRQTYELGSALERIHNTFSKVYGPGAGNLGWYAMEVQFQFDDASSVGGSSRVWVERVRPYPSPVKR